MKMVIDFSKLEQVFLEGWIAQAEEYPRDNPMWKLIDSSARALVKERDRRSSRPRGRVPKSFRFPIEDVPREALLRFQFMAATTQVAMSERDCHHAAQFCCALSVAAGQYFLKQSLN